MDYSWIPGIFLGLGLSSAVGFRVFVPALITSIAAHFNYLELAESMSWMGSIPAMVTFGMATIAEILAYYMPVVDNVMDVVAAPAATICGSLLMGSTIIEMDPFIKWPISIIAGGGLATAVHSGTATIRAASTGYSAGLGNPVISTLESVISCMLSVLSIVLPLVAGVIVIWLIYKIAYKGKRKDTATDSA